MLNKFKRKFFQEFSYGTGRYCISPEIVSLVVTYACNFKCQNCTVWRMAEYPELSRLEWKSVVEKLKNALSPETTIEISGGEPLLCKELVCFIVRELRAYFKNVGINSNGSLLNKETIDLLKESGITYAKISLYSLENEIHDELRGFSGAAENAKKAIELLGKRQVKTDIGVLITAKNIANIPEMIKYYCQVNYPNVAIILQPLDEPIGLSPITGKSKQETVEKSWPDKNQIGELFSWLDKNSPKNVENTPASLRAIKQYYLDKRSALNRRCFAGQRSLVVYPDGKIAFCYNGGIIGNISKEKLPSILRGNIARKERGNVKKCTKNCRIIGCNFSKTISEIVSFK